MLIERMRKEPTLAEAPLNIYISLCHLYCFYAYDY